MTSIAGDERGVSNALVGVIGGVIVLAAAGALVVIVASDGGSSDGVTEQGLYISIGDSIAAGNGASNPAATSFAALLAEREGLALVNVGTGGAVSQIVIDEQLPDVLPLVGSERVRLITISAGGNDLGGLIPNAACIEDPLPAACPIEEALAGIAERLSVILAALRDANARVPIVLLAVPNLFSGTGHAWEAPAGRVLPLLMQTMRSVAAKYDRVTVAEPSFDGRGGELTHVNDAQFDPHPNDAGHRVIADAIERALDGAGGGRVERHGRHG